jgi:hypothetical protein
MLYALCPVALSKRRNVKDEDLTPDPHLFSLFPLDPKWSIMDQKFKEIGGSYEV